MTDEELKELEEVKASANREIIYYKKKEDDAKQELYYFQDRISRLRKTYHEADLKIAEQTKLTICPPTGSGKIVNVSWRKKLTKEEALKLVQDLED